MFCSFLGSRKSKIGEKMLPNKLIEAIEHIKENGCDGINCTECPLTSNTTQDQFELCNVISKFNK